MATTGTPFFSTTVGRAVVNVVVTGALSIVVALAKDPTVAGAILGIGGMKTALDVVQDVLDALKPNV